MDAAVLSQRPQSLATPPNLSESLDGFLSYLDECSFTKQVASPKRIVIPTSPFKSTAKDEHRYDMQRDDRQRRISSVSTFSSVSSGWQEQNIVSESNDDNVAREENTADEKERERTVSQLTTSSSYSQDQGGATGSVDVPESMIAGQILESPARSSSTAIASSPYSSFVQSNTASESYVASSLTSSGNLDLFESEEGVSLLQVSRESSSFYCVNDDFNFEVDDGKSEIEDIDKGIERNKADKGKNERCLACRYACGCCVCDCNTSNQAQNNLQRNKEPAAKDMDARSASVYSMAISVCDDDDEKGGIALNVPQKVHDDGLEPFPDFGKSPLLFGLRHISHLSFHILFCKLTIILGYPINTTNTTPGLLPC